MTLMMDGEVASKSAMARVPLPNFSISNTPSGPFQTTVFDFLMASLNSSMVFGPMSRPCQPVSMSPRPTVFVLASFENASATTVSTGRSNSTPFSLAFARTFLATVEAVFVQQRIADLVALGLHEGVGHAAADDQRVHQVQQVVDDRDLVGHLRAAENRDQRPVGIVQHFGEVLHFLRHEEARGALASMNLHTPSVEECARCTLPKASLTYTSPSFANSCERASSFFVSPL